MAFGYERAIDYFDRFYASFRALKLSNIELSNAKNESSSSDSTKIQSLLAQAIFEWMERNCDYFAINKFVRKNKDYLGELLNIYVKKKRNDSYDFLPYDISAFNSSKIYQLNYELTNSSCSSEYNDLKKENDELKADYEEWLEVIKERCGTNELEKLISKCEKEWNSERRGGY